LKDKNYFDFTISDILKHTDIKMDIKDNITINHLNTLKNASKNELSFFDGNQKYIKDLENTKAGAVLISQKYQDFVPKTTLALPTNSPSIDLAKITKLFVKDILSNKCDKKYISELSHINDSAYIGNNATIEDNVIIMPNVYIGNNVIIKKDTIIYPNVSIYSDTIIGENVIIHSNSVIGSDGFGFASTKDGKHIKIYHLGFVEIENDVEIGSNCSIDKGVFGATLIKSGSKIDNLIQIGHNCIIGNNCLLASQVGLSGSCELGNNVTMGGQSGSVGHIKIGDFSTIVSRGGVTKPLAPNNFYGGFPAVEYRLWKKMQAKLSILLKGKK
jgi:UDP-3-O-[3-hydroxymyristoyl] glucosamine N-acyltransferase